MRVLPVKGYTVVDNEGNILVRSVSPTQRAARVNWLVTSGMLSGVSWDAPDAMIKEAFDYYSQRANASLVECVIAVKPAREGDCLDENYHLGHVAYMLGLDLKTYNSFNFSLGWRDAKIGQSDANLSVEQPSYEPAKKDS